MPRGTAFFHTTGENSGLADASVGEGALLGGMLAVRMGGGLRGHVMSLMERLNHIKLPDGGSLYTAFAYMAVMHAEGLDFLSRTVLAEALACDASALQKDVIFPLGREAGGGGTLLLTRHRRIARAAVEVMREKYGEDIDRRYVELAKAAKAALHVKGRRQYVPELHRWDYDLPQHFLEHQPDLAVRIGQALLDKDPENSKLAVNLARLYRESGSPAQGAELLQGFAFPVGGDRGFWHEWGTRVGMAGNPALSAWLIAWSVADQPGIARPENDQGRKTLAGLGVAFGDLHERHGDQVFIEARGAVGQLGLQLRLDATTRSCLDRYVREARQAGVTDPDRDGALRRLRLGLAKAWELCGERDALADRIPNPAAMSFNGLASRLSPDNDASILGR